MGLEGHFGMREQNRSDGFVLVDSVKRAEYKRIRVRFEKTRCKYVLCLALPCAPRRSAERIAACQS